MEKHWDEDLNHYQNATTDAAVIQTAALIALNARTTYRGEVLLPCVPAALGAYCQQFSLMFQTFGRPLAQSEQEQLRQVLAQSLSQGYEANPSAMVVLTYAVGASGNLRKSFECRVEIATPDLSEQYQHWQSDSIAAPFGTQADAKVMHVLREWGDRWRSQGTSPASLPLLDVGAGTGRNSLAMAGLGYPVDAIDVQPQFVAQLQQQADVEGVAISAIQADILDPKTQLKPQHYALIVASEVVPHLRTVEQLQHLLAKLAAALRPGGLLLLNSFLTQADYQPDELTRQMAQVCWSSLFTPAEFAQALQGLPLELLSDESVVAYESAHLPASAWPPTPWFIPWATGHSAIPLNPGLPPFELRWLLYSSLS
jgi:SAM-dependent methyltransferase